MKKYSSEQKAEYTRYANEYIRTVNKWCQDNIYRKFNLAHINLDWSPSRSCSRGGMYADGPGINIVMYRCCKNDNGEVQRVFEYKSFDADPVIGGIYTRTKFHNLELTILHEIAHALQYYSYRVNGFRCKPHGTVWKNFYRRLREEFLNPKLEDQVELKAEYDKIKEQIETGKFNLITDDSLARLFGRAASN